MLLRLRMFDINIKYVGAKSVLLADRLSRLVKPDSHDTIPDLDVTIAQVVTVKQTHLQSLQIETKADSTLTQLSNHINSGWSDHIHKLSDTITPFWCFRDKLAGLDGLIMKGNRVVVPSVLQSQTLSRLHDRHQGLTATLQRARRTVYWPRLQEDISNVILCCSECQVHSKKKTKPPEKQISTSKQMEVIGLDLMEFKGKNTLVSVDYFSRYITADTLPSATSGAVISSLVNGFQKFGLPQTVLSDNGPCFKSEEFDI